MTEQDWLESTDPTPMLYPLEDKISDRKCYLFSIACLRRVDDLLTDKRCRDLVEVYERLVDGNANDDERALVEEAFSIPYEADELNSLPGILESLRNLACYRGAAAAFSVANAVADAVGEVTAEFQESYTQAGLVRDIFGNPFRTIIVDPRWLTSNVVDLARTIYEEREFNRMPILADALMDAGCDDEDILNHCRSTGPHVRGCFVVDLLLGKS